MPAPINPAATAPAVVPARAAEISLGATTRGKERHDRFDNTTFNLAVHEVPLNSRSPRRWHTKDFAEDSRDRSTQCRLDPLRIYFRKSMRAKTIGLSDRDGGSDLFNEGEGEPLALHLGQRAEPLER